MGVEQLVEFVDLQAVLEGQSIYPDSKEQPGQAFIFGFVGEDGFAVIEEAFTFDVKIKLAVIGHEIDQPPAKARRSRLGERVALRGTSRRS